MGPIITGSAYTWSQYITPTIVGTVIVTVNEANNRTSSTTVYNSEFQTNGSMGILTRTDTDSAGTITNLVKDAQSRTWTITYPDEVNFYDAQMTWEALLETVTNNSVTCCAFQRTTSMAPPLTSASVSAGVTDSADPSGWLYTLVPHFQKVMSENVSSIWAGQELTIPYTGCPTTACGEFSISDVQPPTYASSAAFLLATSTTRVSDANPTSDVDEPTSAPPTSGQTTRGTTQQETGNSTPTSDEQSEPTSGAGDEPDQPTSGGGNEVETPTTANNPPQGTQTDAPDDDQDQPTTANNPPQDTQIVTSDEDQGQPSATTNDPVGGIISLIGSLTVPSSDDGGNAPAAPTAGDDTNDSDSPADSANPATPTSGGNDAADDTDSEDDSEAIPPQSTPVVIIDGETATQQTDSAFVISSQTLSPGASITLGTGTETTVVAFETDFSLPAIVVGQSTATVFAPNPTEGAALSEITIGSSVVTVDQSSNFVIDGETLAPGSSIVVAGTTIELASGATQAVVDGTTQAAQPSVAEGVDLPDLTIGDTTITADSSSNYIIDGQTLAPGSTITVDGSTIELAPGATEVVVDGTTQVIATSDAIGEYIWSAIGGELTADSTNDGDSQASETGLDVPQQTGSAASVFSALPVWSYVAVASFLGFVLAL